MTKVLLRAPLLTNSGYGVHSRQVFEWLLTRTVELDVECLKWGNTPWNLDPKSCNGLVDEIMKRSRELRKPYDVTFQLQLPDEWDPTLGNYNVGMSAFVETDKCSTAWINKCNQMDMIIVPSTFTKNVIKRSGIVKSKIHVVPEWFNDNISKDNKTELDCIDTEYNHLIIGQLTAQDPMLDRKNLVNTLKWLFEVHEGDKDTGIVIKTNMGRGSKQDKILTEQLVDFIVSNFRKGLYPKLYLIHGNMDSSEVAGLYNNNKIKSFISATRGEGYGLPLVDAAAAGLPVVATNWSGHLEFLKKDCFIPVKYDMQPIPDGKIDDRIFFKDFKWAEPRKDSFVECVRSLVSNYSKHKEIAESASKEVKANFSKQNIKKMYDDIFKEII